MPKQLDSSPVTFTRASPSTSRAALPHRAATSLDPSLKAPLGHAVLGEVPSGAGAVPLLDTRLRWQDRLGTLRCRLGLGRNRYRIEPGLYAVGAPSSSSPVLVTANYKLSLDALRRELGGLDAWILVIDTKGINVWCAAGKGSFSNAELGRRLIASRLALVVEHRELILPQLAAPGVSAWKFAKEYGWKIRFGPVRAADLPAWLVAGGRASPEMRRISFGFLDRVKLIPVDVAAALPKGLILAAAVVAVAVIGRLIRGNFSLAESAHAAVVAWLVIAGGFLMGAAALPALLPLLPFRSFALNGGLLGLLFAGALSLGGAVSPFTAAAMLIGIPPLAATSALAFTGSTTFTSLSGVEREVRAIRLPAPLGMAIGAALALPVIAGWLS